MSGLAPDFRHCRVAESACGLGEDTARKVFKNGPSLRVCCSSFDARDGALSHSRAPTRRERTHELFFGRVPLRPRHFTVALPRVIHTRPYGATRQPAFLKVAAKGLGAAMPEARPRGLTGDGSRAVAEFMRAVERTLLL